jgi:hypothetical protein
MFCPAEISDRGVRAKYFALSLIHGPALAGRATTVFT